MQQVQITPEFINPRTERGGANIKANGAKWYIPDMAVNMFTRGQPTNVTYESKVSQNTGKPYNVITGVNGSPLDGNMQPVAQAVPQFQPPPQVQPWSNQAPPPLMPTAPSYYPAPVQANVSSAIAPPHDTAEDIFITGIVGRSMGSGSFTVTDITLLTKAAAQAWKERHLFNSPTPQGDPRDALNDEIGF